MWKPDITLLLAILLALWWTLDALDRPTLGRYVLAGAGVGLALASKLNGGPIAAPLAIGAVVAGVKDRRHWRGLVAAGITAAIVFVALNPRVGRLPRRAGAQPAALLATGARPRSHAARANRPGGARGGGLRRLVRTSTDRGSESRRSPDWPRSPRSRCGAAIAGACCARSAVLAFPLVYTAIYAASTPYAKENNFLQILPFTALAAVVPAGARVVPTGAARSRNARAGRPPRSPWLALALAVAAPTQAWVYRTQVPDTWELAIETVTERLRPWNGRVAYVEALAKTWDRRSGERRACCVRSTIWRRCRATCSIRPTPSSSPRRDSRATAVSIASAWRRRTPRRSRGSSRAGSSRAAPRSWRILHPREPAGSWTVEAAAADDGLYRIDLPPAVAGEWLSAEVWRRRARSVASRSPRS